MTSSKRKICQAVALIVTAMGASMAMAATPSLVSGGSSLVGPSIIKEFANFPSTDGTLTYFTTNSTTGQNAFLNNDATLYGLPSTAGVDFGNSDAALTTLQVTAYNSSGRGLTDGRLIQIPYVTTPITIPVTNGPVGTSKPLPLDPAATPTVALNDDDLCGIFSGKLTNWNAVTNPDTGALYTENKPIHVVYRSDGSGTTDLLTRHLHAVCTTANTKSGVTFLETQTFASNFAAGTLPSTTFHDASGSGAVATELKALRDVAGTTISAIGYLSPDFTNKFLATSSLAPAATNSLSVASLRSHLNTGLGNANDVVPTAANASTAVSTFAPPTGQKVTDPAGDAFQWVPAAADPAVGYPISGTTNILVSTCYGNPAPATTPSPTAAVIEFLTDHYTNASFTSIVAANGFATVPANYSAAIVSDFLSPSTRTNPTELNIGGAACSGLAGR
jgi:phosphate transport system substrate-binding protein